MSDKVEEKKTWACTKCDKTFAKYISYYSHQKTKHKAPCVPCAHCDKKFVSYALRNSHYYRAMHNKEDESPKRFKPF